MATINAIIIIAALLALLVCTIYYFKVIKPVNEEKENHMRWTNEVPAKNTGSSKGFGDQFGNEFHSQEYKAEVIGEGAESEDELNHR